MKIAFLLGGSGDIGKAIMGKFIENGYRVIAPSRSELDLADREAIENYFQKGVPDVDVLIHSAGFNVPKPFEEISYEDMDRTNSINALSFYRVVQFLLPKFKEKKNGYILAISSLYGSLARNKRLPYVMSKHALNGLVKTLAIELGPYNVKINTLSPGYVDTAMTRKNNDPKTIQGFIQKIPLGRLADPVDIAKVAYFLCSPENTYINGQDIVVDGGFSIGGFQD